MNLSAYDNTSLKTGNAKFIRNGRLSCIATKAVTKRKYYCYVKRYNPKEDCNVFYLVMLDEKPTDRPVCKTKIDNYGRFKFNIFAIEQWIVDYEEKYRETVTGFNLIKEESDNDGDIYKIEIVSNEL